MIWNARFVLLITIASFFVTLTMPIIHYVSGIRFQQGCGDYLKLAADANSIEIARARLGKAIDYLEANSMTDGNTSVFFQYPSNDVKEWYSNLKASHSNLCNLPSELTEADKTNTLIKLRETLLDGNDVTVPHYIQFYPYHKLMWYGSLYHTITLICLVWCYAIFK